jgi:hypothetical protein
MTPPGLRPLPEAAKNLNSVQDFLRDTQTRLERIAQAQGRTAPQVSWQDLRLVPGAAGDGQFDLVYQNHSLDALIRGQVDTKRQEMRLVNERLSDPEKFYVFHYREIPQACSEAKQLLEKAERGNGVCLDGWVEPKLKGLKDQYESLTVFDRYCQKSYRDFIQKNPESKGVGPFRMNRVQIDNQEPGDGIFSLLYHDPTSDWLCRADIPTGGHQIMVMGNGLLKLYERDVTLNGEPKSHPMTDACRVTDALVGPEEHGHHCIETSKLEREVRKWSWRGLNAAWISTTAYEFLGWGTEKIDLKFGTEWYQKSFGRIPENYRHPGRWLTRQAWRPFSATWRGIRALPGQGRNLWQQGRQLVGRLGPTWQNARMMVGSGLTALASRLPLVSRFIPSLATATGTTTTATTTTTTVTTTTVTATTATATTATGGSAGAGGGTAAATGSNPIGWAVLAGVAVGYGLVKTGAGRYVGLEYLGNKIGDGATELFGPADTEGTAFKVVDGVFNFLGLNGNSWL